MKAALKLALVALTLVAGTAQALGLGSVQVHSYLNQPLSATIPVMVDSKNELDSLSVGLGSADAFTRAGVPFDDALASLQFKLVTGSGAPYIAVTSSRIIRAPFLNFLLQAQTAQTTLIREYTVLLDPPPAATQPQAPPLPAAAPPAPVAAPVVTQPHPAPAPHRTPPATAPAAAAPVASTAATTVNAGEGSSYGPVSAQDTLWSIARKHRPASKLSVAQVVLAIYRANPQAFENGSIDSLMKGAVLNIPDAGSMAAVSPEQAARELRALLHHQVTPAAEAAPTTSEPQRPVRQEPEQSTPSQPATAAPPAAAAVRIQTPSASEKATSNPPAETAHAASPSMPAGAGTGAAASMAGTGSGATAAPAAGGGGANPPTAAPAHKPASVAGSAVHPLRPGTAMKPVKPRGKSALGLLALWQLALLLLAVVAGAGLLLYRRNQRARASSGNDARQRLAPITMPAAPLAEQSQPDHLEAPTVADEPGDTGSTPVHVPEETQHDEGGRAALDDGDFEVAGGTAAEPLQLDAAVGDVLADADFHIAYGLYDEAIAMLRQAIETHPSHLELKQKLAETYFAAGRPSEFQQVAEQLHDTLPPAAWEKVAEMGRKLVPSAAVFGDPESEAANATEATDDSAATGHPEALQANSDPTAEPQVDLSPTEPSGEQVTEFDTIASTQDQAAATEPATLDLSEFELQADSEAVPAAPDEPERIDFQLDDFDLEARTENEPAAAEPASVATDDENSTKLDLARAYADIGDNAAARALLDEVLQGGTPQQRHEAEALARRLSA
ncbi:MAG: tetratricopeptide repeat protein [Gammaproteobacteria bacterium]|nr:tetratricopeptide repeat protein [Gammaproteobacteria bacterium]